MYFLAYFCLILGMHSDLSLKNIIKGIEVTSVDHLPIISRYCRHLKIADIVNDQIPCRTDLDPGTIVQAMIIDTLSGRSPLYKLDKFMATQDVELLFGEDIPAAAFNDDAVGRTLDRIHTAGSQKILTAIGLEAVDTYQLDTSTAHFDTTSVPVWGEKYARNSEAAPEITHGYSKDKRGDLKQFMVSMLCVEGNIPILGQTEDGNASDVKLNNEELERISKLLATQKSMFDEFLYVADCKLVSRENLEKIGSSSFVTRLPATYGEHDRAIDEAVALGEWDELGILAKHKDPKNSKSPFTSYRAQEVEIELYGEEYRAIVVETDQLDKRRKKRIERQKESRKKSVEKSKKAMEKKVFACKSDAQVELDQVTKKKSSDLWWLEGSIEEVEKLAPGRAPKDGKRKVVSTTYKLTLKIVANEERVAVIERRAGCFVLLTNTEKGAYNASDLLKSYKEQYGIEQNFSFIKDPLIVNDVFLKKPERIEALGLVLILSLMVWRLIQRTLRRSDEVKMGKLKDFANRTTYSPTAYLLIERMSGIQIIKRGNERALPNEMNEDAKIYLYALGLNESVFIEPPERCKTMRYSAI